MSNNDDNNGIPDRPSFLGRGMPKEHRSYGQGAQGNEQPYNSPVSQQNNDQSEYSQVGGNNKPNQPYPGQAQNSQYGQGNYDQSPYDQQGGYGSSPNYDQHYGQQQSQDGYAGYNSPSGASAGYGEADQQYSQGGYGGADYNASGYQQSYDQQGGYAYPAGQNDGYNYGDQADAEDTSFLHNEYPDEGFQEPRRKKSKAPLMLGALLAILLVGGGVGYAYTNGMLSLGADTEANGSNPILIRRDRSLVKHRPSEAGGQDVKHTDKKFYDRLNNQPGNGSSTQTEEVRLKNRAEEVIEPSNKTTSNDGGVPGFAVAGLPPKRQVEPESTSDVGGVRKVKVIPVRPSGSIGGSGSNLTGVSISSSNSGNLGNQKSRDPGIAGLAFSPSEQNQDSAERVQRPSSNETSSIGEPQKPIRKTVERVVEEEQSSEPVRTNRQQASLSAPVTPERRTRSFADESPSNTQNSGEAFVIQLAARREHSDALEAFVDMQQKYPTILSPYVPFIQRADLTNKGKGIWYRLRVGPMNSKQAAADVCNQLKSRGFKSCFVRPK